MSTPPRPDSTPPSSNTTSNKAKVIVWITLIIVVLAGVIALLAVRAQSTLDPTAAQPTQTGAPQDVQVVRPDSRVLSQAPNEQAVLVEFLDFECEGCAAAYPVVEELRADYADTVTFVHRYFPLPGHPNAMTAAVAVEAAAQQGAYEAMYQKMFETQDQWSHTAQDQSPVFRDYAQDLAAYDAAVADPATTARVEADVAEGIRLGVQGTPTFFLDGRPLTLDTVEQFRAELDAAVAN